MQTMDPPPTLEEIIACQTMQIFFMKKYMFVDGSVENLVNIQNQDGMSYL